MEIIVFKSFTEFQAHDVQALIKELVSNLSISAERLNALVAANNLYRSVGFQLRETNVYNMSIRGSVVSRLREFIENEGRSCSMDLGGITPKCVYRMWG